MRTAPVPGGEWRQADRRLVEVVDMRTPADLVVLALAIR
jgi:hypothetical protein